MAFQSFVEWMSVFEARSRNDEFRCPHPNDKEFCRQWGLYMQGKAPMPVWDGDRFRKSTGHYTGPRASEIRSDKDKGREGGGRKGGRHDWRKDA
jgi:hypothetical protein